MVEPDRAPALPTELVVKLVEVEQETGISVAEQLRVAVRLWNMLPALAKRGYQNLLGDNQSFFNAVIPNLDELLDWMETKIFIAKNKAACEEQLIAIHRVAALMLDRVAAFRNRGNDETERWRLLQPRSEKRGETNESEIERILRRLARE